MFIEHVVSGLTARDTAGSVGINKGTAAYSFHWIRAIIACQIEQELYEVFGGEIDASEFGGYRKGNRGGDAGEKVAFSGL